MHAIPCGRKYMYSHIESRGKGIHVCMGVTERRWNSQGEEQGRGKGIRKRMED